MRRNYKSNTSGQNMIWENKYNHMDSFPTFLQIKIRSKICNYLRTFLDAAIAALQEGLSVRWSVGPLVRWSVGPLVGSAFVKIAKSVGKSSFSVANIASIVPSIYWSVHPSVRQLVHWSVFNHLKFANIITKTSKIYWKSNQIET